MIGHGLTEHSFSKGIKMVVFPMSNEAMFWKNNGSPSIRNRNLLEAALQVQVSGGVNLRLTLAGLKAGLEGWSGLASPQRDFV